MNEPGSSRRVGTHEKNSGETVRRLGTIIQSIFCAQSGAGIRLNFWKQFGEGRYPGALSPVLENFRRALSSDPITTTTTTTTSLFLTLNMQISHHLQIARLIGAGGV